MLDLANSSVTVIFWVILVLFLVIYTITHSPYLQRICFPCISFRRFQMDMLVMGQRSDNPTADPEAASAVDEDLPRYGEVTESVTVIPQGGADAGAQHSESDVPGTVASPSGIEIVVSADHVTETNQQSSLIASSGQPHPTDPSATDASVVSASSSPAQASLQAPDHQGSLQNGVMMTVNQSTSSLAVRWIDRPADVQSETASSQAAADNPAEQLRGSIIRPSSGIGYSSPNRSAVALRPLAARSSYSSDADTNASANGGPGVVSNRTSIQTMAWTEASYEMGSVGGSSLAPPGVQPPSYEELAQQESGSEPFPSISNTPSLRRIEVGFGPRSQVLGLSDSARDTLVGQHRGANKRSSEILNRRLSQM
ncbi:uncharacterized protein BJ171DRAFT_498784 [Polychytrium aggregatum]|uniref:uncharacterized protein n=1 Tax=Polychytrium aggregatum TaxID=110093 RepID=UPI0022FE7B42|nr:uncharacterized protein BJ171DRAFT_498784 [Polychytrium aggregatum]KAI9206129.1 hypothetical protein BJ171DRAFT_498784 [Polychytrium aggregatum]